MVDARAISPLTPVIVGAGQSVDRIDAASYRAWSAPDLAAAAAAAAFEDTGRADVVRGAVDAIGTTRTFEDTLGTALFGKSSNFPRSIARRLGIDPAHALLTVAGGNTPNDLVIEFGKRIFQGEFDVVLLTGAEAISTVRNAQVRGTTLDFAEEPGGQVEDRGPGVEELRDPIARRHGVVGAPVSYALAENARRHKLGLSKQEYAQRMGRLFEPFARAASANPYSAWAVPSYSVADLLDGAAANRWIADPYPLRLVSRDQVNQGAALILTSLGNARKMGIPEETLVFLHGYAKASEKPFLTRPDMGASPAARGATRAAFNQADVSLDKISLFDFYSCFPIAVSNVAIDELSLAEDDPRGLTVTGGLPYFGGPGNNYSMHALAELVGRLRQHLGTLGFVGANGGILGKYSAGIYSTRPREWASHDSEDVRAALDRALPVVVDESYTGPITVETYSVLHAKAGPQYAMIIGKNDAGRRVIARTAKDDTTMVARVHNGDFLGQRVNVVAQGDLNLFGVPSP